MPLAMTDSRFLSAHFSDNLARFLPLLWLDRVCSLQQSSINLLSSVCFYCLSQTVFDFVLTLYLLLYFRLVCLDTHLLVYARLFFCNLTYTSINILAIQLATKKIKGTLPSTHSSINAINTKQQLSFDI